MDSSVAEEAKMKSCRRCKEAREALTDIMNHSCPPFAKVDPRTDNMKWLNYYNQVAKETLEKMRGSR